MPAYRDLWIELCSYDNLFLAYQKARKHKTTKEYVIEFEKNLQDNLCLLRTELLLHCYKPKPLINFIVREPKTRKISKSDFRDRIVHHALCNIIEPIFDKGFIYDSYANRKNKGTLKAVQRFDYYKRKLSRNNTIACYVFKADIKKYFEHIDHKLLFHILKKKIADRKVLWLIRAILSNSITAESSKGMPLGNLTSQFFANVYLNELDWFVKTKLKAAYYIRYVDDFVMLHPNKTVLEQYMICINSFLRHNLALELHPDKSKILRLGHSLNFLGFRVFYHHKLLKTSNLRKMKCKFASLKGNHVLGKTEYDSVYDFFEGWMAYAAHANTYTLRKKIIGDMERSFPDEISSKDINRYIKTSSSTKRYMPNFCRSMANGRSSLFFC